MNALELIQRIVTAKQGDAIGSQISLVADGNTEDCNMAALSHIRAELETLQSVDWEDVAKGVEDLIETLDDAGVEPRW